MRNQEKESISADAININQRKLQMENLNAATSAVRTRHNLANKNKLLNFLNIFEIFVSVTILLYI